MPNTVQEEPLVASSAQQALNVRTQTKIHNYVHLELGRLMALVLAPRARPDTTVQVRPCLLPIPTKKWSVKRAITQILEQRYAQSAQRDTPVKQAVQAPFLILKHVQKLNHGPGKISLRWIIATRTRLAQNTLQKT